MTDQPAVWLEALPMPALLCGRDGFARGINRSGREAFVWDAQAPIERQSWRVLLFGLGPTLVEAVQQVAAGDVSASDLDVDGPGERRYRCRIVPVGEAVLVSATDTTAERARDEALQALRREYRTLWAALPATVLVADASGQLRSSLDGEPRSQHRDDESETLRRRWEQEAPHDPLRHQPIEWLETPAMRALGGQVIHGQRIEVRRPEGRRVVEAHAAPMRDADGRVSGVVVVEWDVTELVRLELRVQEQAGEAAALQARAASATDSIERLVEERSRALLASQEEQVRERRLAALGQLAAGVMHDVNNALNPIMAAAYLLRHHAESPEAVRDYADRIRKAAEIGAATASRVGRFIRQEPVHVGGDEVIDLSALADEVVDLTEPMRLRRSSEAQEVRVERQLGADVHMRGLPGEIREALLNLVQNAIDAMPKGGTLTLRTAVEGNEVCIAVRDTGVGMTEEVRERAFDPFFSTKGAGGTGLGLAEVYGIARRHRGSAAITSVPERGTEVLLRFPRWRERTGRPTPSQPLLPTQPQRILVVEDHDDGRDFLRRILEADGHAVTVAASVREGEAALEAAGPPFDLLLTDVGLPDGSGWSLVKTARARFPDLRVGVITGWEPQVGTSEAQAVEFVLRKPLRAAELKSHIAAPLRRDTTSET
ncbi:MAG: PAS domain-containing protein [Gemmatimonadaceae bacterium]|nr:PAS domain-containing protein [Gemmatimonadaceae bacterium]